MLAEWSKSLASGVALGARMSQHYRPENMTNNALIFDLDGTLVDSLPGIAEALNAALTEVGFPEHPVTNVRNFVGDGLETTIRRASPKNTDTRTISHLLDKFRIVYTDVWKTGTRPYQGIQQLLMDLHSSKIPLAVLSNKTHAFTVEMVAEIFADIRFACVLGLQHGMLPKPDPSGALEIAKNIGCSQKNITLIGDSTMDIETAQHAGMHCCAVTWGYHDAPRLKAANPNALISTVSELRKMTLPAPHYPKLSST